MIDMLTRRAIQVLRQAGHEQRDVAKLIGVGVRTVRRVDGEPDIRHVDDTRERERRAIGRPAKAEPFRSVVAEILAGEPDLVVSDNSDQSQHRSASDLSRAMVVAEKPTETLTAPNGTDGLSGCREFDEFVAEPLMVAFAMVEVDNPTPTILSREKSVIHGIPGSVAPWPSTRCSSSTGSRYVTAVLKTIGRVES